MKTKETAVGWLVQQFNLQAYTPHIEQAKQMEKEQMKDAFVECWLSNVPDGIECKLDAEQYYNKTYGKE